MIKLTKEDQKALDLAKKLYRRSLNTIVQGGRKNELISELLEIRGDEVLHSIKSYFPIFHSSQHTIDLFERDNVVWNGKPFVRMGKFVQSFDIWEEKQLDK